MKDEDTDIKPVDFRRVERAIRFLEAHAEEQPDLKRVAQEVGMSEYHFQRLFRRWAGVSPKRFLQFLTAERAAAHLRANATALETAYRVGLSGTGRLHDLMVSVEAATPGELRSGGEGLEIAWGVHPTPFGPCLLATTPRGICELVFLEGPPEPAAEALRARWPAAKVREDAASTRGLVERAFAGEDDARPLTLLLRGTNFQLQVWRALLTIPSGQTATYGELARAIGAPAAARAVGGAIGDNRIAYLIPCHRVIRATGAFGGYRWGVGRKRAMLALEASRHEARAEGRTERPG